MKNLQTNISLPIQKHLSLFFLPGSKLTISLISTYKHNAINIVDPSSMKETCHMNFVIDLAHCGVSATQWLEHRSAESEGLRFDFSWGLKNVCLSYARHKAEKTFFCIENLSHMQEIRQ